MRISFLTCLVAVVGSLGFMSGAYYSHAPISVSKNTHSMAKLGTWTNVCIEFDCTVLHENGLSLMMSSGFAYRVPHELEFSVGVDRVRPLAVRSHRTAKTPLSSSTGFVTRHAYGKLQSNLRILSLSGDARSVTQATFMNIGLVNMLPDLRILAG